MRVEGAGGSRRGRIGRQPDGWLLSVPTPPSNIFVIVSLFHACL